MNKTDKFPECLRLTSITYSPLKKKAKKGSIVLSVRMYPWQDTYTYIDIALLNSTLYALNKKKYHVAARNLYGLKYLSSSEYLSTKVQVTDKISQWLTTYDEHLTSNTAMFRKTFFN